MTTTTQRQDQSAGPLLDRTQLYIGGEWAPSAGEGTIDVINPATEQVIARVAEGSAASAGRARVLPAAYLRALG